MKNAKVIELTGNNVFCRNLDEARRTNEYVPILMPMTASVPFMWIRTVQWPYQNPTSAPAVQKSKHEPKAQETDVRVSSDTVKDASFSWKHSLSCIQTAAERNLPIMSKTECCSCFWRLYFRTSKPCLCKDGDNRKI